MNQPELARLLQEVGAVPAPAADYGAVVRASVARGRAVRSGILAVAGLAVVGALAAGAIALSGADQTVETLPRPTPTAEPTPTPTEEPSPTQEPTDEPTAEPTAEPTVAPTTPAPIAPPTQAPPPTRAPEPTAAPTTKRPTPRPTTAKPKPFVAPGLSVSLSGPSTSDQSVTYTVSVRDTDGRVLSAVIEWGDASSSTINLGGSCGKTSGTDPEALSKTQSVTHTYANTGQFTAVLRVQTGSSCRPTPKESDSDTHVVEVV